jgi:GH15 family glucan-1,4-alpha-glucosidase
MAGLVAVVVTASVATGWSVMPRRDGTSTGAPRHVELVTTSAWRITTDFSDTVGPTADQRWLSSGTIPGAGTAWADMVRYALLDLHQLSEPVGSPAAGAGENWGYSWPRDNAFAAAALAKTGHAHDAELILGFLARVQGDDGGFQARYLLGSGDPPDGRSPQSDGAGWALWALDQVAASSADPRATAARFQGLLEAATGFALDQVSDGSRLPPASSDYWEQRETKLTLGTAAPLLAGLCASARLFAVLDDPAAAARSTHAADGLELLIKQSFQPDGYQRYETSGGTDAAICFLMPPFTGRPSADVAAAWRRYQVDATRPAGGLAPGASWKQDGISWTPETALVAFTAASDGDSQVAAHWLDWLNSHRTTWGSLPEKVNSDGTPGGPAPLAWTAASVILAVSALDAPGASNTS